VAQRVNLPEALQQVGWIVFAVAGAAAMLGVGVAALKAT